MPAAHLLIVLKVARGDHDGVCRWQSLRLAGHAVGAADRVAGDLLDARSVKEGEGVGGGDDEDAPFRLVGQRHERLDVRCGRGGADHDEQDVGRYCIGHDRCSLRSTRAS